MNCYIHMKVPFLNYNCVCFVTPCQGVKIMNALHEISHIFFIEHYVGNLQLMLEVIEG